MRKIKYLIAVLFLLQLFSLSAQTNMTVGEFEYDDIKFIVTSHESFYLIRPAESTNILANPETIDDYPTERARELIKIDGSTDWKSYVKELSDWNQVVGRGESIITHFRCNGNGEILSLAFSTDKSTKFRNISIGMLYKMIMDKSNLKFTSPNDMHKKMNQINFSIIYDIE
ncbi:hypothetical protein ACS126_07830 [Sphingobacterium lactis]|uniref:hypothetical protein n=1 Tax=Sphingobacterium lactis TaxID=797291 RepID=UPI003EC844E5